MLVVSIVGTLDDSRLVLRAVPWITDCAVVVVVVRSSATDELGPWLVDALLKLLVVKLAAGVPPSDEAEAILEPAKVTE